jgi:hypothetical protein
VGEGPSRRTAETAAATRALEELRRERAAAKSAASASGAASASDEEAAAPSAPNVAIDEIAEIFSEPAVASRTRATSRRTPG